MKNTLSIILALLAGLVIGNFSVKPDLRRAREEINSLKGQLNVRGRRDDNLRSVTSMLRVPQPAPRATSSAPVLQKPVEPEMAATNTGNVATGEVRAAAANNAEARRSFREQIQTAVELWKTRSELARNNFLADLSATPAQTQQFDQTITNMNAQVGEKIRQWTDYVKQQQDVTPETTLRMMNDLSATIVGAYDELDGSFPADWREKAGSEFQLLDFINPEVGLPFAELQDTMASRSSHRGRRSNP
jgi:hypothetical protein